MPQGYKVVLKSSQYRIGGHTFIRPFETMVAEGSPELGLFQGCLAFELTPCMIPEGEPPVSSSEAVNLSGPSSMGGDSGGIPIENVPGISKKKAAILKKAGYITAEMILSENVSHEDLTSLDGIDSELADKIIEACSIAIGGEEGPSEEGPTEEVPS